MLACCLVACVVLGSVPAGAQPAAPTTVSTYPGRIVLVDVVAVLTGVGLIVGVVDATPRGFSNREMLALTAGAVTPYLIGAPLVHLSAGNGASAIRSAGWRSLPLAVGFGLAIVSCQPKRGGIDSDYDGTCLLGAGAGVILGLAGMVAVMAVDPVLFARKSVRAQTTTIVPTVSVVADGAALSVGGTF